MDTEENVGYQDAMRQVSRSVSRRIKVLENELESVSPEECTLLQARMEELQHLLRTIESLHR